MVNGENGERIGVPGEILIFVTVVRLDRICMLKSKE
jgi:hypothetical protein